jgi:iron complex transport system substrate-binding protein
MSWGSARWVQRRTQGCELSSNRRLLRFWCICVLSIVLTLASPCVAETRCKRIVSLAPSITEMVFELGLGDRLVGATEFCRYPPEALEVPRVGGYLDLSIERIANSQPNVVFGLRENQSQVRPLSRFPITVDLFNHSSLEGIKASYSAIASRCGVEVRARELLASLADSEQAIADKCATARGGNHPQRVMVVVGRTREGSADSGVYISGNDGFYSDIIKLLGVVNVHDGSTVAVPTLSAEGILKLAPDVILDVINVDDRARESQARDFWRRFPTLPAVQQGRIVVLSDDFASIPGPRYVQLAEKVSKIVCGPRTDALH